MASNGTVVSVGNVSVTTTGTLANTLLQQIASITAGSTEVTVPAAVSAGTTTAPITLPAAAGTSPVLTIPATDTGVISIPAGYTAVVYEGTGTLVGGDSLTAIIGGNGLNYTGPAGTVIANGTGSVTGTIVDSTPGAHIAVADAGENVMGSGEGQVYSFDSGSSTLNSAATTQGAGSKQSVSVDGTATLIAYMNGSANFMQSGGNATFVAGPGGNTFTQTAGSGEYWASAAGDSITLGSAAGQETVAGANSAGVQTLHGGAGADTIFAAGSAPGVGGVIYYGNSASTSSSFLVAGKGTSTIYTAANETMYGNTGGSYVSLSSGSNLVFLGGGGADTITGNDSTGKATIWGLSNETITSSASVGSAAYIVNGNNSAIDITNSSGGSNFLALDGGVFAGNATLTMSNAGHDGIALFSADVFGLSHVTHTLTIANWQSTDILDLSPAGGASGYGATVAAAAQSALASGNSFTLPDGTTVTFTGNKPTTIANV